MRTKHTAKHILMALFCVLFIICLSVTLTVLFRPVYCWDIEYLQIAQRSGIPADVCRKNYDILIDYNLAWGPDTLEFPDFIMSESGRIHFEEVKVIFVACQYVALAGLMLFAGRIWWQCRRGDKDFHWLRYTMWVALAIVAAVGSLVAINWDLAFTLMHKVLFNNDLWIFNASTDPIIKILPDEFFMHCGILIMVLVVVFVIGCRLLAKRLEK
ncbi:MAG: TIGR01906 family membrane protein [Firmicutes bacterium]|nr:TIGR01906 family membrane protein [Bacillota bacterium]